MKSLSQHILEKLHHHMNEKLQITKNYKYENTFNEKFCDEFNERIFDIFNSSHKEIENVDQIRELYFLKYLNQSTEFDENGLERLFDDVNDSNPISYVYLNLKDDEELELHDDIKRYLYDNLDDMNLILKSDAETIKNTGIFYAGFKSSYYCIFISGIDNKNKIDDTNVYPIIIIA